MERETLELFKDKQILLVLKNEYYYTCKIQEITSDSILILDKFNLKHLFNIADIKKIQEVKTNV